MAALALGVMPGASLGLSQAMLDETATTAQTAVGQPITIRLTAMFGAGYSWAAEPLPTGVTLIESRTEPRITGLDGAPDTQVFELRADRAGSFKIRLIYRRPFERGVKPRNTLDYVIHLAVAPAE